MIENQGKSPLALDTMKRDVEKLLKKILDDFNASPDIINQLGISYTGITLRIQNPNSYMFPMIASINEHSLTEYLQEILNLDEYSQLITILNAKISEIDGKIRQKNDFLKSPVGRLIKKYLLACTRQEAASSIEDIFPVSFEQELFDKSWNGIIPWITETPIRFKIFYPMFDVTVSNYTEPLLIEKERNLTFKIPSKKEREQLADDLQMEITLEGIFTAQSRLSWIAECSAWIEGELEISIKDIREKSSNLNLNLVKSSVLEEAFFLSGLTFIRVYSFLTNDYFDNEEITIDPLPDGRGIITRRTGIRHYPAWMNSFAANFRKEEFMIDKIQPRFFTAYIDLRKRLRPDSTEILALSRFIRSIRSKILSDTILETAIGIEMLLVSGKGDLSLQFRLNTSWLLGDNYRDRSRIEKLCKSLYSLRSNIVHEGGTHKSIISTFKKTAKLNFQINQVKLLYVGLFRLVLLRGMSFTKGKLEFLPRGSLKQLIRRARLGDVIETQPFFVFDVNYTNFMELVNEFEMEKKNQVKNKK